MNYNKYFKEYIVNTSLVFVSSLIAIIIIEVILNIFAPIPYSMEIEYQADGCLGCRLTPNKVYKLISGGNCSINNLGFRGNKNVEYFKPINKFRIVVLGGSAAFSYQVDDSKIWTSLLEKKLKDKYNYDIEVINAGVPGYSIFESKINYLYMIRRMSPDIVILYHTWNDMKYFRAIESGSIIRKGLETESKIKSFSRHFQIMWRIRNSYHKYILPRKRENVYSDSIKSKLTVIKKAGKAHQWEKKNYEDISLILKSDNVLPVFLTQAGLLSRKNVDDMKIRSVVYSEYQGLSFKQILEQWESISNIIKTVAINNNLVFIDVYSACPHGLSYFEDHVHLTELGNKTIAEIIFNGLVKNEQFKKFLQSKELYKLPN